MDIAFNTKPAVSFMSVSFDGEVIEELNDHIENELIDSDAVTPMQPIKFSHTLDYVGKMFGDYICRLSGTYMKNSNTDIVTDQNASEVSQSVTGNEHREYDCNIISMSVDRIFCDTIQQGNTDGELSCVLYLKVPEQISGMVEIPGYGMVDDGTTLLTLQADEIEVFGKTANELGTYTVAARDGKQVDIGSYVVIWKKTTRKSQGFGAALRKLG